MDRPGLIPEYKAKYKFPFSYTVTDAAGRTVHTQTTALKSAWGRGRSSQDTGMVAWRVLREDVGARGGTLTVEHSSTSFPTPSGRIRVAAKMDRDTWYKADARDVELVLWDNAHHDAPMFVAILLVLLGLSTGVAGLLLATRAPATTRS